MLNNFIYAQTKDLFLEKLNAGEILDEAIVFIEDTKEIWNHGHYFAGSNDFEKLTVFITYEELKTLRDNSQLIPGQQYRITDYVTITTQKNTQSVGYPFDIIVTANNKNVLNEEARVCLHEGDTYFVNSNLAAWKIWYCLDNDKEKFVWADTENGKGVVYRMIDEYNNDCPYDFKNIKFERYLSREVSVVNSKHPSLNYWDNVSNIWLHTNINDIKHIYCDGVESLVIYPNISDWGYRCFYTFDINNLDGSKAEDVVYNNKILPNYDINGRQILNNNVFIVSNESPCYGNNIKEYCYENTFRLCRGIELNRSCGYNYLSECHNMTLGNNNYLNILFQCENTVFGNKCSYNNFMCVKSSTLKNDCEHNVICKIGVDTPNSAAFDYEPHFISLDDGCYGNVINSEMDDFIKNGNTTYNVHLHSRCSYNQLRCGGVDSELESGVSWIVVPFRLNGNILKSTLQGTFDNIVHLHEFIDNTTIGIDSNGIMQSVNVSDFAPDSIDWNADGGESGHIKNRTHYYVYTKIEGPGEFEYYGDNFRFRINSPSANEYEIHNETITVDIAQGHNSRYVTITHDYANHLVKIDGAVILYVDVDAIWLSEEFIPDTIARTSNTLSLNNQDLTAEQQLQVRTNINALTSYEYYAANNGVLTESQYNIMIKYLFTPFMISSNDITIIPDELLNTNKTSFFTDWYWNVMRITGGEPITTIQWKGNSPYRFMGIVNRNVFVIDFTNKTITPEVATASLEEIEFRVNNTVYIADSYMNWDNYINSDYNNGNWTLCGDLVYLNGQPVLSSHGQVYKHEIILADETYTA